MQVEVVYQMVFGELNNLSPCPLPLQGKGEKEKRGGFAPSLKDSFPSPLKESHAKLYEEDTMRKIVLLLIAILICGLTFGCATPTTSVPTQPPPAPPKVFEKTVNITGFRDQEQTLEFYATAGSTVEGEVIVDKTDAKIRAESKDPYGNIIIQSARKTFVTTSQGQYGGVPITGTVIEQRSPWQFAFIAATTGNYTLTVLALEAAPVHLKVTVYEK